MSAQQIVLFSNQTTNANGTTKICDVAGTGQLLVWGTFDGATVKLQTSPDGTTWLDVPNTSTTAALVGLPIRCTFNESLRGVTSGGGANMAINMEIRLLTGD